MSSAVPTGSSASAAALKPGNRRKHPQANKKLSLLHQNLVLVPFTPSSLDLSRHERLFSSLGLLDFARLHLDRTADLRLNLIADLIVNYDPLGHRSILAGGTCIFVDRRSLARALSLLPSNPSYSDLELFNREHSIAAVVDFVSDRMVFLEDACVVPGEVVAAIRMVKAGLPHMVDWAGLMWTMVEKELLESPRTGRCFYASHLQRLVESQRPELFEPAPEEPDLVVMDSPPTSVDSNIGTGVGLGLGAQIEGGILLADGKDVVLYNPLQGCSSIDLTGVDSYGLSKGGEGMGVEEGLEEVLAAKLSSLEVLTSTDMIGAMGNGGIAYPLDQSRDFVATGNEAHKNMEIDHGPAAPLLFVNDCKREINKVNDDDDDDDDGDDLQVLTEAYQQKWMRSDGQWGHPLFDFDNCMEKIHYWFTKAKMAVEGKAQAYAGTRMQLDCMLQQKDQIILSLEKTRMEDLKKMRWYEQELNVMTQVVFGYKRVLKETRNAFEEYRKQFPGGDEPLYSDVGGTGGVLLTIKELEKKRLEEEKVTRDTTRELIDEFRRQWLAKLLGYGEVLTELNSKLCRLDEEAKLIKEEVKLLKERVAL